MRLVQENASIKGERGLSADARNGRYKMTAMREPRS
jgi:hypothetical protein